MLAEVWLDSAVGWVDFVLAEGSASEDSALTSAVEAEVLDSGEAMVNALNGWVVLEECVAGRGNDGQLRCEGAVRLALWKRGDRERIFSQVS